MLVYFNDYVNTYIRVVNNVSIFIYSCFMLHVLFFKLRVFCQVILRRNFTYVLSRGSTVYLCNCVSAYVLVTLESALHFFAL
jgi:hypothetical protein